MYETKINEIKKELADRYFVSTDEIYDHDVIDWLFAKISTIESETAKNCIDIAKIKTEPYEKCNSCKNKDNDQSNQNWTVCSEMPIEVMTEQTSKNCAKYERV